MILVDVNIFMDVLERRKGWTSSMEVISQARQKKWRGYISALTVPILWFLRTKYYSEEQGKIDVREIVRGFEIVSLDESIIESSFESRMKDFEDALQFYSAKAAGCTQLITRNVADFKGQGSIDVLTPEEFLGVDFD
jgi:predicted nucleic-acid-binding protein